MKKSINLLISLGLTLGLLAGCGNAEGKKEEGKYPQKEIEFVVPSSAGGGSDLNARTIADIAFKNKFTPKNFMVVNKPGGSGAVSFSYVYNKKEDPHTLMVLHSGQVMSAIVNDSPIKADALTYIGTVALDELAICVKSDGKYKNLETMLKDIKEKSESIKIGGSQRGNGDHLAFEMLNKYTNSKFTYVQFNSSGDAMSALLGGHIDAGIFNPLECIGQIEAKKVTPIAVYSPERLTELFKDAPTFKELGYEEIELREIRAISGPPNMPAEAVKFYEDLLKKVTETEEWKKNYIEKNLMTNYYLNSADTKKYFDEQSKLYHDMFKEVGLIK
ncbi:tripartite tricarboxylate transporter substrate binding protein [Clostridium sp. MSJ-11]|uniref:Tripartite tricarboxylate transporter substrate binding protein n=1 Tax=Clostridium mobile TaxID=2841512 RepID=A0ABS6EKZ3_9CLOT|nr:tripartite tricarboxylate transporter substrate binding protein [Clostridium mobile]MBU5485879.1 tripartite tricarboxylate transporter substrate binding protein [Clostridium mobile]